MSFNQSEYTSKYNKDTYKMYQFRVRRDNLSLINALDNTANRNDYIVSLVDADVNKSILTIKQIREAIMPILAKYDIKEVYLFGSYARGEARPDSDVDIYCEPGSVKNLYDVMNLEEELKKALKKDVDVIYTTDTIHRFFEKMMRKDLIKLC